MVEEATALKSIESSGAVSCRFLSKPRQLKSICPTAAWCGCPSGLVEAVSIRDKIESFMTELAWKALPKSSLAIASNRGLIYATFLSACMRTIHGWRESSWTSGQRPIPRPFSATGSTSLEPEPLAPKPTALIATIAVLEPKPRASAGRTGRTLTPFFRTSHEVPLNGVWEESATEMTPAGKE